MTADDAVRVPVAVHARVQQVDIHQILRIGDGVQAGTRLSFGDVLVGNALRGHDAVVDGTALVVSIRIQTRALPPKVGTPVVVIAAGPVHACFMGGDPHVALVELIRYRWSGWATYRWDLHARFSCR